MSPLRRISSIFNVGGHIMTAAHHRNPLTGLGLFHGRCPFHAPTVDEDALRITFRPCLYYCLLCGAMGACDPVVVPDFYIQGM